MDLRFTAADEAFRAEVRAFLSENLAGDFAAIRGRGGPGWLPSGRGGSGCPGTVAGGITVAAAAAWPSPIPEPCHASWPGNWPGVRSVPPQGTFRMISTW